MQIERIPFCRKRDNWTAVGNSDIMNEKRKLVRKNSVDACIRCDCKQADSVCKEKCIDAVARNHCGKCCKPENNDSAEFLFRMTAEETKRKHDDDAECVNKN